MRTMLGKAIHGAGTVALLSLCVAAGTAAAQDKTIRVGITLRMMVESGIAYGDIAKSEIEAVNAKRSRCCRVSPEVRRYSIRDRRSDASGSA